MSAPVFFETPDAFRTWLTRHGGAASELIVGFHKVATGTLSLTWSQAVDEALCFGWIDGIRRRIDDASYSIRFTPRRSGGIWSAVNIAKMVRLEAEKRVTPAGATAFALRTEAKSAIYSHEQESIAELRPSEKAEFERGSVGWAFFQSTPAGYRKRVLHWVTTSKKEQTRRERLAKVMEACASGERLRQFR